MTLAQLLRKHPHLIDDLTRTRLALLPGQAPPPLQDLGLADERGLTRKGQALLTALTTAADLLDLPIA